MCGKSGTGRAVTWAAPEGEEESPDYTVEVNGEPVFVYCAGVRHEIVYPPDRIATHEHGGPAERASFAMFDFEGRVEVVVTPGRAFGRALICPARHGVEAEVSGGRIRFAMERPMHLTVMPDGEDERPLHLFTGPPETDVPGADDPGVVYFGPGIHETGAVRLDSGQTLYLAAGAVVKGRIRPGEEGVRSERTGLVSYGGAVVTAENGRGIRIAGRGILDGSLIPHAGKSSIAVSRCRDVRIEGIVIRDSSNWNITVRESSGVEVSGVKIISGRLNSDGVNSVGSRDVHVKGCFVRNHDDSIAVKTTNPGAETSDVVVEDCTIWNDWGFALGATYETRAAIHDVTFRRVSVIFVRNYAMGVYVVDSGTVSGVRFEDIEVENIGAAERRFGVRPMLVRLHVSSDMWGTDDARGRIRDVTVSGVRVMGDAFPESSIMGYDGEHRVERVKIEDLCWNGKRLKTLEEARVGANEHTRGISIG
ncbi:MAG: right-handed parallel beta-helix repeat-containing protein [Planctomycetes bacterium]|nr:right-handed parallel beta-helix repeat-containing protein [Planctomycetota bacterium]